MTIFAQEGYAKGLPARSGVYQSALDKLVPASYDSCITLKGKDQAPHATARVNESGLRLIASG